MPYHRLHREGWIAVRLAGKTATAYAIKHATRPAKVCDALIISCHCVETWKSVLPLPLRTIGLPRSHKGAKCEKMQTGPSNSRSPRTSENTGTQTRTQSQPVLYQTYHTIPTAQHNTKARGPTHGGFPTSFPKRVPGRASWAPQKHLAYTHTQQ